MRVSPDFFATLGLGPVIGRTFTKRKPQVKPTMWPFFTTRFGGNASTPIRM